MPSQSFNDSLISGPLLQRVTAFLFIVSLHLALWIAFESGTLADSAKQVETVVQAVLLKQEVPVLPPPPVPKVVPHLPPKANPAAYVPPVESPAAATPGPNAIAVVSNDLLPPSPTPISSPAPTAVSTSMAAKPALAPVKTSALVDARQCEKPAYPSMSRRMQEEGVVVIRFLIGIDGKVIEAVVDKSSGHLRLDEAAKAGLSKCHFIPASTDGRPEQSWASISYAWRLD